MKLRKSVLALSAIGLMAIAGGAQAAAITFQFNPMGMGVGAGLINGADVLDQAPGNNLALNAVIPGGALPVGYHVNNLYQANLNSVMGGANNLFSNGSNSKYFTFVAGFEEVITGSGVVGNSVTNVFSILPGGFFKMCAQAAPGSNLAGTGFSCAGQGILSGYATGGNAIQGGFLTNPVALDQFGPNDYDGKDNITNLPNLEENIKTVVSSGSANLELRIDFVDAMYFPDLLVGGNITLGAANTPNITPFSQANPSKRFSSDGVLNGNVLHNLGAVNGAAPAGKVLDFQFQADANTSFSRNEVPEPGTLALLGLAVAGLGGVGRKRRSQAAR